MSNRSTPLMGVNTTDVVAMNPKLLLTVIVISASLLLTKQRSNTVSSTPRTFPVLFKDGTEGKAVRLNARNNLTVFNWVDKGMRPDGFTEYRESVAKGGQVSNQRIMLSIGESKAIRAAYFDDWIVKTEKGFQVVKFDKSQETIFFVDKDAPAPTTKRAFNRWVKDIS